MVLVCDFGVNKLIHLNGLFPPVCKGLYNEKEYNITFFLYSITDTHLTRALTANLTTVESRKRGVTRMWNSARAAKASEGLGPVSLKQRCIPNVYKTRN